MEEMMYRKQPQTGTDKDGNTVFLADNGYMINLAKHDFPEIEFHTTSEFTKN